MRVWTTPLLVTLLSAPALGGELPDAITPDDFPTPGATSVLLGRDLFFDPILSGNKNIACASCHIPSKGSSDAMFLTLGEGGTGLGPERVSNGKARRITRHTPHLFNLGAHEFENLLHDGRVARDDSERFGFALPGAAFLERPVASALSAQALMPITAPDEMAGIPGSNPIADAVAEERITGMDGAWHLIAQRVEAVPEYRQRFDWLIGRDEPIHATHIADVLAAFVTYEFRATDSAFDAFLAGDDDALSNDQLRGMALFYGKAGCDTCHSGAFQTDHGFHAIGVPQIGPGKGHGADGSDHGRAVISENVADLYAFRTPSLRNVTLTAPYGHTGAYPTLEGMVRHHLDPMTALAEYIADAEMDQGAMEDFDEVLAISAAITLEPVALNDAEVDALLAFLDALTDTSFLHNRLGVPQTVPSGLPVEGALTDPS